MTEVLIAGAGPTGLVTALSLARAGRSVRIVDAAERPFAGSRGDGLQPRTLEVFEDLGVLERVLAGGGPPLPVHVWLDGRFVQERVAFEQVEPSEGRPYPNIWFCPQFRTEAILRERLAELGVEVEFGTRLVEFSQSPHAVSATLVHDGQRSTACADYLVGADGGRSAVRKGAGIGFAGSTREDVRMLLGDVRVDGLDRERGYWFATAADPMLGVALTPLPGTDQFQFGAPLDRELAEPGIEDLRAALAGACVRRELSELTWCTTWRPNIRMAERFVDRRVFLAGEAAHVHPPTGGQGLNTGVQDGYNLGWKLAAVLDGAPESLLDTYERERLPVAAQVLDLSTELLDRYERGAENAHERGEDVKQFGVHYRGGQLAVDEGAPLTQLRAGDRAPDGQLQDGRLFELLRGPRPTTLGFGVDVRELGPHAHDASGALPHYGATGPAVVVIRPDGHLGYVGSSVRSAKRYLAGIGSRCGPDLSATAHTLNA